MEPRVQAAIRRAAAARRRAPWRSPAQLVLTAMMWAWHAMHVAWARVRHVLGAAPPATLLRPMPELAVASACKCKWAGITAAFAAPSDPSQPARIVAWWRAWGGSSPRMALRMPWPRSWRGAAQLEWAVRVHWQAKPTASASATAGVTDAEEADMYEDVMEDASLCRRVRVLSSARRECGQRDRVLALQRRSPVPLMAQLEPTRAPAPAAPDAAGDLPVAPPAAAAAAAGVVDIADLLLDQTCADPQQLTIAQMLQVLAARDARVAAAIARGPYELRLLRGDLSEACLGPDAPFSSISCDGGANPSLG